MKVFVNKSNEKRFEEGPYMPHERGEHEGIFPPPPPPPHELHPPLPPHRRRTDLQVRFEDGDWNLLKEVFGDEDTAFAAAEIIRNAPPEIQVIALQLMNIIKEVA